MKRTPFATSLLASLSLEDCLATNFAIVSSVPPERTRFTSAIRTSESRAMRVFRAYAALRYCEAVTGRDAIFGPRCCGGRTG